MKESWGHSRSKVSIINYTWVLDNFSFYPQGVGELIKSPRFPPLTQEWRLKLSPKGETPEDEGHLSLYVYMEQPYSFKFEQRDAFAKITLSILNDKGEAIFTRVDKEARRFSQGDGRGYQKLIKLDSLLDETTKLLTNDRLIIQCTLEVVRGVRGLTGSGSPPVPKAQKPSMGWNDWKNYFKAKKSEMWLNAQQFVDSKPKKLN